MTRLPIGRLCIAAIFCVALWAALPTVHAQQSAPKKAAPQRGAEKAKPSGSIVGGRSDEEITRLIRKALQGDRSLSAGARKVGVTTLAGYVTLKGTVRTAAEKSVIEAKAATVAGDDYVIDLMTVVKPPPSPKATAKNPSRKPAAGR